MRPRYITIRLAISTCLCMIAVLGCLLSLFYKGTPTALRTPGAAFCGLSSLFIIYRIICLSHKRYIFRKGVYHSRDLDQISGADFEALSCDILVANGFEFAENTQASVDFGVDVLARREGITYAIQCKRMTPRLVLMLYNRSMPGVHITNAMSQWYLPTNILPEAHASWQIK